MCQLPLGVKIVPRFFSAYNGIDAPYFITFPDDREVEGLARVAVVAFVKVGVLDDVGFSICSHVVVGTFGVGDGYNLVCSRVHQVNGILGFPSLGKVVFPVGSPFIFLAINANASGFNISDALR